MNDGVDAFITLINFYILLQDFPALHFGDCPLAACVSGIHHMIVPDASYSKHHLLDGVLQFSLFPYFNAEGGAFVNL